MCVHFKWNTAAAAAAAAAGAVKSVHTLAHEKNGLKISAFTSGICIYVCVWWEGSMHAYVDLHEFACLYMFLFAWVSLKLGTAVCSGSVGGYEHVCPY